MCLAVDFFEMTFWVHSATLICIFIPFAKCGKFLAIIPSSTFSASSFSSAFRTPSYIVPQIPEPFFTFSIFFLTCVQILVISILYSNSPFFSICSVMLLIPFIEFFYFGYYIFWVLNFSFVLYIYIYILLPRHSILLISRIFIIAYWNIYAALKYLSDNSNLCHLGVSIYWLSFLVQFEIFMILVMMSDFHLKPGYLGNYIMRL